MSRKGYYLLYKYNVNGATIASYVFAHTDPISTQRGSARSYYLLDAQGSVRAMSTGSATLSDQYSYTAFGETRSQTGSSPQPYGYTGQQRDAATGLYYLRARYYAPGMGRFLSRDPAALNQTDPREWNRYGYTANNPINASDPSGWMLLDYQAAVQTGSENAQNYLEGHGWLVGSLLSRVAAAQLAIEAQQIERAALAKYHHQYGSAPAPDKLQGRYGLGLAEYIDVDGNRDGFAALNAVGLKEEKFQSYEESIRRYYTDFLIRETQSRGFRFVNEPFFSRESNDVDHIERFLLMEGKRLDAAGRLPIKNTIPVGVPYNSICGTCVANIIGDPGSRQMYGNVGELFSWLDSSAKRRTGMVFRALSGKR